MDGQGATQVTELSPTPDAVADARHLLRRAVGGSTPADAFSRAELALSEIVTNALTHGRAPVCLRVTVGPDRITVGVTDAGDAPMRLPDASPDDSHGRGLAIVAAVVTAWGWEQTDSGGRLVWFTVASPPSAALPDLVHCA